MENKNAFIDQTRLVFYRDNGHPGDLVASVAITRQDDKFFLHLNGGVATFWRQIYKKTGPREISPADAVKICEADTFKNIKRTLKQLGLDIAPPRRAILRTTTHNENK